MLRIQFDRIGAPEEVFTCVEAPDPGPPGPDEVLFDVLAFPINPTDLLMTRGFFGPVTGPTVPGSECVGRIVAVGANVTNLQPGDIVINMQRANWAQRRLVPASAVIRLRKNLPLAQAAMLKINPPTALGLIEGVTPLAPGDWIVQNAANSAVGRIVNVLAREHGYRVINIVRRAAAFAPLRRIGAEHIVLDGPELEASIAEITEDAPLRYLIDCIGGATTARMMNMAANGGTVCVYGVQSGEDFRVPPTALLYRTVRLAGFSAPWWLQHQGPAIHDVFNRLADMVADGRINIPVRATYGIEAIGAAVRAAKEPGQDGKVLVLPNGPLV